MICNSCYRDLLYPGLDIELTVGTLPFGLAFQITFKADWSAHRHSDSRPQFALSVRRRLADLANETVPREQQTPAALAAWQKAEIEKWWPIIKAAGIKAE